MGKDLLAKAHIAKLNELTVSEVTKLNTSTVDATSRGITIVSSQRKFKFNI